MLSWNRNICNQELVKYLTNNTKVELKRLCTSVLWGKKCQYSGVRVTQRQAKRACLACIHTFLHLTIPRTVALFQYFVLNMIQAVVYARCRIPCRKCFVFTSSYLEPLRFDTLDQIIIHTEDMHSFVSYICILYFVSMTTCQNNEW